MSARILVLEDDPALSESIAAALAGAGYGVLAARTRAEAERLVLVQSFDLALCDVNLPDGDGFGFCRWLKARRDVRVCFFRRGIWRRMCSQAMISAPTIM